MMTLFLLSKDLKRNMHKKYLQIEKIGNRFVFFGLPGMFLIMFLSWTGLRDRVIFDSLFLGSFFCCLYGLFVSGFSLKRGFKYSVGKCKYCEKKNTAAFFNFCIRTTRFCQNCNVSLLPGSVLEDNSEFMGYLIPLADEKQL